MSQPAIDGLATIATYDCRDFEFTHLQSPLFHDVLEVSVARLASWSSLCLVSRVRVCRHRAAPFRGRMSSARDGRAAAVQPPAPDLNLVALVIEIFGLGRDDLEVVIPPTDVTVGKETQVVFGRVDRLILLHGLVLEDAQRREIVLDLLESGKGRLAIVGDGCVVMRARRFRLRMAAAPVKDSLTRGEAYRPQPARPVEPGVERAALEPCHPVQ